MCEGGGTSSRMQSDCVESRTTFITVTENAKIKKKLREKKLKTFGGVLKPVCYSKSDTTHDGGVLRGVDRLDVGRSHPGRQLDDV